MLKFIGWGKKSAPEYITQHQLFQGRERSDCSSGTRSSSQWLCWRHIAEVTSGIISLQNNSKSQTCEGFPGPPITYLCHRIMCGLNFEAQGALTTTAADQFPLSNLPANAHPHAQDFDRKELTSVYPADSTLICPQTEINAVQVLGKFNTDMFFQRKFAGIRHGRTANCPTCLIVD